MRGFDCFVLPALAKRISNTILKLAANRLPRIATDVDVCADLVVIGETGLTVPAADVDTLAASIVRAARAPGEAAVRGYTGRQRVKDRCSLQSIVMAYASVYRDVLGRDHAR
jgi:glycosyltransferase involved in cell wall biosynthesis